MADNFLMKGKVYGERKHKLLYPVFAEVKYDEIRLHVKRVPGYGVQFLSYAGKPLHNLEFWHEGFLAFFNATGLLHLDMGVLVNNNFNDSYRWTRSSSGIPDEKYDKASGKTHPRLFRHMVEFYLFDVPELTEQYEERRHLRASYADQLTLAMAHSVVDPKIIRLPQAWYIPSEEKLEAKFTEVRELGYEGLMVKSTDHVYVAGCAHRSDGWLKMKPESEADGKVAGLNRAVSIEGVPLDRIGSMDVVVPGGTEFGDLAESYASPAGIPHELGRDMFLNPRKYLGRWIEFKYMERDRQGGYRHPSFTRFRDPKE